jgi:hypothetical protein
VSAARTAPLLGQRLLALHRQFGLLVRHRVGRGVDGVRVDPIELLQRAGRQRAPVRQVTPGDQHLLRVRGQPALTRAQQLVDLVGRHPVVLCVVQDGQKHVQVVQRVGQPQGAGQGEVHVRAVAGQRMTLRPSDLPATALDRTEGKHVVERDRRRDDGPAQRLEQRRRTAPAAQHRHVDLQRDGLVRQPRAVLRLAAQGAAEDLGQGAGEQAGRGVRAVVDVLAQRERLRRGLLLATAARGTEPLGVDVEQQRRGAPVLGRVREQDVGRAGGDVEGVHLVGVLDQQVTEIGRRPVGGRHGEQHWLMMAAPGNHQRAICRRAQ